MHNIKIAQEILRKAKQQGAKRTISLEIGELSNTSVEELEETLKSLTKMKIELNLISSKIKCSCGYLGIANILDRDHDYCYFNCPKCSNNKPEVLEGKELKIIRVF